MELARTPRLIEGNGWHTDKLGRWRSRYWRRWVAANYSGPIPLDARPDDLIVAAHMRYPGCGISTRPADCLIYAMPDTEHKRAHNTGQDTLKRQWLLVTATMLQGLERRLLLADDVADGWIRSQHLIAVQCEPDLSTESIEYVAARWASLFLSEQIKFNDFTGGIIPS